MSKGQNARAEWQPGHYYTAGAVNSAGPYPNPDQILAGGVLGVRRGRPRAVRYLGRTE